MSPFGEVVLWTIGYFTAVFLIIKFTIEARCNDEED